MLTGSVALRGQTQKQQHEVMDAFRRGEFNVLVATCIGEVSRRDVGSPRLRMPYLILLVLPSPRCWSAQEGLDIGEVCV